MPPAHLRPMGIGEILDGTFSLYRKHFALMFGTALVPFVLLIPAYATILPTTAVEDHEVGAAFALGFLLMIAAMVGVILVMGAVTRQMSQAFMGGEVSFGDGFRHGLRALLSLIGTLILAYLALVAAVMIPMFGSMALAGVVAVFAGPVGVILALVGVILALVATVGAMASIFAVVPAVVVERKGPIGAIIRSWQLSRGARIRIAFLYALCWLISVLPTTGILLLFGLGTATFDPDAIATMTTGQIYLQQSVTMLVSALTFPFLMGSFVLLYYDRRIRTEAFDVEVATAALAATR